MNGTFRINKSTIFAVLILAMVVALGFGLIYDAKPAVAASSAAVVASETACYGEEDPDTVWDNCPEGTTVDPEDESQCLEAHETLSCPSVPFSADRWYCANGGLLIFHTCWKGFNSYPATYESFSANIQYEPHANGQCKRPSPAPVPTWAIPDYNHDLEVFEPYESETTYTSSPRPSHLDCEEGELVNGVCVVQVDCECVGDQVLIEGICYDPICDQDEYLGEDHVCHEIVCEEGYHLEIPEEGPATCEPDREEVSDPGRLYVIRIYTVLGDIGNVSWKHEGLPVYDDLFNLIWTSTSQWRMLENDKGELVKVNFSDLIVDKDEFGYGACEWTVWQGGQQVAGFVHRTPFNLGNGELSTDFCDETSP